jgi:hypothetical protein
VLDGFGEVRATRAVRRGRDVYATTASTQRGNHGRARALRALPSK